MLKIRLMRIGAKKRPFYRVVAVDERSKRTGGYIELLGTYDPMTHPHDIKLKQDRIDHWVKQGAQLSDGFLRIIGKAPQRPPRKPKKEKKEEAPTATSPVEIPSQTASTTEPTTSEPAPAETPETPTEPASKEPEPVANTSEVEPEVKSEVDTSEVSEAAEEPSPEPEAIPEKEKKDEGTT